MFCVGDAAGQRISGTIVPGAVHDGIIRLSVSRGSTTRMVDSTVVAASGRFNFTGREYPLGFYHLSVNDTDQVDIILAPAEEHVELEFSGLPLQRHIRVKRSDENKRLWEYKLVSKESQAVQAGVLAEKQKLQVTDSARILELDSIAGRAVRLQEDYLHGIMAGYPTSYLAKVVKADRGVDDLREQDPLAIRMAVDFSDPSLMRSAVYDKAVLTFLRNLRATREAQFVSASDSLLVYAAGDPECQAYMLDHLIGVFSTYGPEMALQHLIDRYVATNDALQALDPSLHAKVTELLKVSIGAEAPDVDLPRGSGPLQLRSIVGQNRFTALFFYGSSCEHCHMEMPTLKEVYSAFRSKGLEVIGIALDADSTEFQRTIDMNRLPWKCYSEFNGWGSSCAKAFQVRATPFFYLLDQRMRIVAKPVDAIALGAWLHENTD